MTQRYEFWACIAPLQPNHLKVEKRHWPYWPVHLYFLVISSVSSLCRQKTGLTSQTCGSVITTTMTMSHYITTTTKHAQILITKTTLQRLIKMAKSLQNIKPSFCLKKTSAWLERRMFCLLGSMLSIPLSWWQIHVKSCAPGADYRWGMF